MTHTVKFATSTKMSPLALEILKPAVREVYGPEPIKMVPAPAGPGVLGFGVDSQVRTLSPKQILTQSNAISALIEGLRLYKDGSALGEPVIHDVPRGMEWVYIERIEAAFDQPICFDLENAPDGTILSISVTGGGAQAVFTSELRGVAQALAKCYYLIGHGAKSDQVKLMNAYGIKVLIWFDTMIARHVMHPSAQGHYGLKDLGMKVLGLPDWEHDIRKYTKGGDNADYSKIPHERLVPYNAWDTFATWHLYEQWLPIVADNPTFWHEMKWSNALADVEFNKIAVDVPYVESLFAELEAEKQAQLDLLPPGVNYNSWQQLQKLFASRGLELKSTDEKTLTEHLGGAWDDIIVPLLEYRGITKQQNTYAKAWLRYQKDGLIQTTFNVHGTASARLSGSNPNLQNVPREKRLRKAFVPRAPGRKLVEVDYAQGELRVQAILSGDPDMIAAFQPDSPDFFDGLMPVAFPRDFPTLDDYLTYETMYCGGNEKDFRAKIKATIYGLNFGRQAPAIAAALGMPTEDAQEIIDNFMAAYPVYAQWRQDIIEAATDLSKRDLLTSWTGHKFESEVITWRNKGNVERSALSFLPQATLAGLCTTAACNVNARLKREYGSDALLVLAVHDALYADATDDVAYEVSAMIASEMEAVGLEVFGSTVIFAAEGEVLDRWGGAVWQPEPASQDGVS